MKPNYVNVPISVGELYDKITILEIKLKQLPDLSNVIMRELSLLRSVEGNLGFREITRDLVKQLWEINHELWEIEEAKRLHEKNLDFGVNFTELSRMVYIKNDIRATLKREINNITGSLLQEVKSHETVRATVSDDNCNS